VVICRSCQLAAALVLTRPLARGRRDRTAAERQRGAAVLAGRALPPGWAGKACALDQGLRAARGDLMLFLDADTLPRPELARALAR
jgi:glycosyltransferase involved in cell wall biosynthesis